MTKPVKPAKRAAPWLGFQFTNAEFTALSTADFEALRKADAIIQQTKKDRAKAATCRA